MIMSTAQIEKAFQAWPQIEPALRVPHNEREYHPLASLMEVLGVLIEKYEDDNVAELA